MADQTLIRPDESPSVLIVGGGSLGNALNLALSACDIKADILDFDTWEASNAMNCVNPGLSGDPKGTVGLRMPINVWVDQFLLTAPPIYDIVVTATDNIESRAEAYINLKPKIGFLDMRTGLHTATIVRGDTEFMLLSLPEEGQETENYGCGQIGSMGHTMAIAGLGMLRLLEGVNEGWTNQYNQLGIFGKEMTLLSMANRYAPNATERDSSQSHSTQETNTTSHATYVSPLAQHVTVSDTNTAETSQSSKSATHVTAEG